MIDAYGQREQITRAGVSCPCGVCEFNCGARSRQMPAGQRGRLTALPDNALGPATLSEVRRGSARTVRRHGLSRCPSMQRKSEPRHTANVGDRTSISGTPRSRSRHSAVARAGANGNHVWRTTAPISSLGLGQEHMRTGAACGLSTRGGPEAPRSPRAVVAGQKDTSRRPPSKSQYHNGNQGEPR